MWLTLERQSIPEVNAAGLPDQIHLYNMDAPREHRKVVDEVVTWLLRPMGDQDLSLVFDPTILWASGLTQQTDSARRYALAKSGLVEQQFMPVVVQSAEGLLTRHKVFDGGQAESRATLPTLQRVLTRFAYIKHLIVVIDRG